MIFDDALFKPYLESCKGSLALPGRLNLLLHFLYHPLQAGCRLLAVFQAKLPSAIMVNHVARSLEFGFHFLQCGRKHFQLLNAQLDLLGHILHLVPEALQLEGACSKLTCHSNDSDDAGYETQSLRHGDRFLRVDVGGMTWRRDRGHSAQRRMLMAGFIHDDDVALNFSRTFCQLPLTAHRDTGIFPKVQFEFGWADAESLMVWLGSLSLQPHVNRQNEK